MGLIAYPALLISMVFIAYGNYSFESTEIFTITIVNNDIEEVPQPENLHNASLLFCKVLSSDQYKNTFIIEGINIHTMEEAVELLDTRRIDAIVEIDGNFSEAIYNAPGYEAEIPTAKITVNDDIVITAVLGVILLNISNEIIMDVQNTPTPKVTSSKLGDEAEYDLTLFDLLTPGIIIGSISICLSLLTIVFGREKEFRTLHRLITTPVDKRTIFTSIMITQFVAATAQFFVVVSLSLLFGTFVHPNVNWGLIFLVAMLFNLSSMGIGLFLGSIVKNGKSAALISFFVAFTMMMIGNIYTIPGQLSGSMVVPNSYAVDAVRNIMLYGKWTLIDIGFDLLMLTLFGTITILIGLLSFSRKQAIT
ncbi:MAG: ABC transporter permease [Promethearchaeota archaeon]